MVTPHDVAKRKVTVPPSAPKPSPAVVAQAMKKGSISAPSPGTVKAVLASLNAQKGTNVQGELETAPPVPRPTPADLARVIARKPPVTTPTQSQNPDKPVTRLKATTAKDYPYLRFFPYAVDRTCPGCGKTYRVPDAHAARVYCDECFTLDDPNTQIIEVGCVECGERHILEKNTQARCAQCIKQTPHVKICKACRTPYPSFDENGVKKGGSMCSEECKRRISREGNKAKIVVCQQCSSSFIIPVNETLNFCSTECIEERTDFYVAENEIKVTHLMPDDFLVMLQKYFALKSILIERQSHVYLPKNATPKQKREYEEVLSHSPRVNEQDYRCPHPLKLAYRTYEDAYLFIETYLPEEIPNGLAPYLCRCTGIHIGHSSTGVPKYPHNRR